MKMGLNKNLVGTTQKVWNALTLKNKAELMEQMPIAKRCSMYARFCTDGQLRELVKGWDLEGKFEHIIVLKKYLKKRRRIVPDLCI